jgi:hypothetical protein
MNNGMVIMRTFFGFACLLILVSCSSTAPKCGDSETLNLVEQILAENTVYDEFELIYIRTTDKNEETGSFECAANVKMKNTNGGVNFMADNLIDMVGVDKEISITYTVELTDSRDEFFVQVYGL